jgi:hypothetical protein
MSRVSPEHARTHDEDAHHLLSPADLVHHIPEHHGVNPSEALADWYMPDFVQEYLRTHGIPSATEPVGEDAEYMEPWEIDGLVVWHGCAHENEE